MKNKILITGGNGAIGFRLAERLSKDFEVMVLDRKITRKFNKNVKTIEFDLSKPEAQDFFDDDLVYIYHLACIKPSERGTTEEEYRKNIKMTENVAEFNKKAKIIYSSAGTIYGSCAVFPIKDDETIRCNKNDYYCLGKIESEKILERFSKTKKWSLVILRITNVYGSDFRRKGEILPNFFEAMMRNEPLVIYENGEQRRDRIFIDDLVQALVLSMKEKIQGVFNIGSGESYSTLDVAEMMGKILKKKYQIEFQKSENIGRKDNLLDIVKAKDTLGYKPKTKFEKGLKLVLNDWIKH